MMTKTTPKILVVDDEIDIETLFRHYFRKETRSGSVEFLFALDGKEAIKKLESDPPLGILYIFSDINMPKMNGFELLNIIQQKYSSVKVCMISAYGASEYQNKAKSLGADSYITKPVDFSRVKAKIEEIINTNQIN